MFRHLYVLENNKKKDILQKGELSCACYLSSILKIFDLISSPHVTVKGTLEDMTKNDWHSSKKLKPGNVLLWEAVRFPNGSTHQHLGFYLGKNKAMSNSPERGVPIIHHFTYGQDTKGRPKRKIIKILTHRMIK